MENDDEKHVEEKGITDVNTHGPQSLLLEDPDDAEERRCGLGRWRPESLQKFANVQSFIGVYSVVGILTSLMVSYLGSQIPSIEKQFGLTSSYSGIIMSFNDIGYFCFILFISSLAKYVHIPLILFSAFILYGISGILCSLPHFIGLATNSIQFVMPDSLSTVTVNTSDVTATMLSRTSVPLCAPIINGSNVTYGTCADNPNAAQASGIAMVSDEVRQMFLALFGIGMMLQGVGKSLRGPFVTVYIDDNGKRSRTGYYMGVLVALMICGPAIGYAFGGMLSRVYVTLEDVDISPRDPRWIGAWWLGFLVFGAASIVFSLPLTFFPRHLKKQTTPIMAGGKERSDMTRKEKIKEGALSYWRVVKNPVYMGLMCSSTIDMAGRAGYYAFLSKYIHTQFNIPLWQANITMAIANISSIAIGAFLGGLISRKFKFTPRTTIGMLVLVKAMNMILFSSGLLLGCNQPDIVGPNSRYTIDHVTSVASLPCSSTCNCNENDFFPVCGSNGVNYHSPCYAGCESPEMKGGIFSNCTCIPDGGATAGLCDGDCNALYPFAVFCFIAGLALAILFAPGFLAQIRCVEDRDKSTGIGLTAFCTSLLGFLPSPIIFGKLVDSTCLIWQKSCGIKGACLLYDIVDFRLKIHLIPLAYMIAGLVCLSFTLYKVRYLTKWSSDEADEKMQELNNASKSKQEKTTLH